MAGRERVEVDGHQLAAEHVVPATGPEPVRPPIEGLDGVAVWINREATTLTEIPQRALMIGGSAVGVEIGLFQVGIGCA